MKKDMVWKAYLSDDRRFADLINGILFHGTQTVSAKDLTERDTQTGYLPQPGERRQRSIKIRDTVREVRLPYGLVRIGIECEEYIDYSMPLRDLGYTAGEYEKQAAEIRRCIRQEPGSLHGAERMYRFKKDSRLLPSVSLILYCGKDEWDGPRTLHDMIDFADLPGEIHEWTQNYRIHILEVRKMKDTSMFCTDVRQVLDFIRNSSDKQALKQLVTEDPYYQNMEEDAWNVIVQYAKVGKLVNVKDYYREDGKIDMCTALIELLEDERREGEKIGELRGEKRGELRGEKRGEKRGVKRGEMRAEKKYVRNLMKNLNLTEKQAMEALEIKRRHRLRFFKKRSHVSN